MGNWYLIFAGALAVSFAISVVLTDLVRRAALHWAIMDHPGERKVHGNATPLLGGVAIFVTFNAVAFAVLWMLRPALGDFVAGLGNNGGYKLLGLFAGGLMIFVLGVVDDIKMLGPEIKLTGQILAVLALVIPGIRLDLFIDHILLWLSMDELVSDHWFGMLNTGLTALATMFWVIMMTNAMNFLDNMDGLSGGVSVIAALSFFLCLLPGGDYVTCLILMIFAGSVAGFLYHNLNPARIFMGDAGSMFCGYLLATVAVLGTFYSEEQGSPVAIAAPLLALSVPIFDILSVVAIRLRNRESIMRGDKRHFSHRLVNLGMTPRQAVEFIFLAATVTGLGAAVLPQLSLFGVTILLAQTVGVFLLIVLLMQAGKRKAEGD